jgi:hypothetical protein
MATGWCRGAGRWGETPDACERGSSRELREGLRDHDRPGSGHAPRRPLPRPAQGEDIGDNGGIRIALAGLDRALAKKGTSAATKGPDGLTARQRFFAGNAFSWCQNLRPEFARVIIRTNPHSLHEYRVNYVLANQPEFREAFSWTVGKPMARQNACRVW